MTTILPGAFETIELTQSIKAARTQLDALLNDTEDGDLRVDNLKSTRMALKRLLSEVDQRIKLLDTPSSL